MIGSKIHANIKWGFGKGMAFTKAEVRTSKRLTRLVSKQEIMTKFSLKNSLSCFLIKKRRQKYVWDKSLDFYLSSITEAILSSQLNIIIALIFN